MKQSHIFTFYKKTRSVLHKHKPKLISLGKDFFQNEYFHLLRKKLEVFLHKYKHKLIPFRKDCFQN